VIGWGTGGPLYADEIASRRREGTLRLALQEIADAQGDVDAFIAQQSEKAKTVPRVAAEIAKRLLEAGRAKEAWTAINAVDEKRPGWIPFEWEQVRLDVMEALGRNDEAQARDRNLRSRAQIGFGFPGAKMVNGKFVRRKFGRTSERFRYGRFRRAKCWGGKGIGKRSGASHELFILIRISHRHVRLQEAIN